ncbi:MAG: 50S ribosomal protein L22 [Planctomycetota bacterium]|nr:MAG: 50S ribosomal protein L22 [Planctomycetota bacterium]
MVLVRALCKHARISARKIRPFADIVRGKSVGEGLEALRYLPNRGARLLEDVIKSAAANAEDRGARNVENLAIAECTVDSGPMFKRFRPRGRGMVFTLRKRFAHIQVSVDAPEVQAKDED